MLKRKPGLAVVETIIVLAISGLLFAAVITTFSIRRRAAVDDAARQVMSEIARVRNQAQQGYVPDSIKSQLSGYELFGMAIKISNGQNIITVKYLKKSPPPATSIYEFGSYDITMPSQLKWIVSTTLANSCTGTLTLFNSCKTNPQTFLSNSDVWLVFRNNTGQSYLLSATSYGYISNYTSGSTGAQPAIKLAFANPTGIIDDAAFQAANAKYYAIFDLSVPNNQSLQVVK